MTCYSFRKRLLAFFFGSLLCVQAQAVVITALATDVPDIAGPNQWQITYRVSDLPSGYIVSLLFPTAAYGDLAVVEDSVSPLWVTPIALPGNDLFDGELALEAIAAIDVDEFAEVSISFTRLAPFADQFYTLFDSFTFERFALGTPTIAIDPSNDVPEPATWALVGLGVAMLGRTKGRRARPMLTAPG